MIWNPAKVLLCAFAVAVIPNLLAEEDLFSKTLQPIFAKHCVECHGKNDKVKGKVNLLEINSLEALKSDPDLLSDLIGVIEDEEMPPEDEPQPTPQERKQWLTALETVLAEAIAAPAAYPRTPIRRMNRFQYANAVKDLLNLKVEVFSLPERIARDHGYFKPETGKMEETLRVGNRPLGKSQLMEPRLKGVAPFPQDLRAEHGFDNRGDHLSLSPLLMESFLRLSQSIVNSDDFGPKTCLSWKEIFAKPPTGDPNTALRERISTLLTRAFRRPQPPEIVDRYTTLAKTRLTEGSNFPKAMKTVVSAILASPKFLYLYEQATRPGEVQPIDDYELATRLSFLLWGSIPDAELHQLAGEARLSDPEVLSTQINRMLKDRKLKHFCDAFPAQWLQLDRLISSAPDKDKYPEYYFSRWRNSMHTMLEPLLLFETILIENRSILELIDSDYTYRTTRMQKLMTGEKKKKLPGKAGTLSYQRVSLTDRRYGGVITTPAVMAMTSGTDHSKPITRGEWLSSVILNDPPMPPPADVPPLPKKAEDRNLTIRERFAKHRERADCASCHNKIDPLGFAMENYDPTGMWRDRYENGRTVDPSGVLLKKHSFKTPVELKDALLAEKDRFTLAFSKHLLAYALGRKTSATDAEALADVAKQTADDGYRLQTVLKAIIHSPPFSQKYTPAEPSAQVTP